MDPAWGSTTSSTVFVAITHPPSTTARRVRPCGTGILYPPTRDRGQTWVKPARNGANAMVEQLRREGVDVIFGLPGDQLMVALDALYDEPAIRYITTRHEQAHHLHGRRLRARRRPSRRGDGRAGRRRLQRGVGPRDGVRLLVARAAARRPGEPPRHRQRPRPAARRARPARRRAPDHQVGRARPDADRIPGAVREAFRQMRSGPPRPVEIEIPPETFADASRPRPCSTRSPIDADDARPRRDRPRGRRCCSARANPLIIAGGGVVLGDATAELADVAELLQAAVVTTREGKGAIDDRNPLVGRHDVGQPAAAAGARRRRRRARGRHPPAGLRLRPRPAHRAPRRRPGRDRAQRDRRGRGSSGDAKASLALLARGARRRRRAAAVARRRAPGAARVDRASELRAIGPQAAIVDALRAGDPRRRRRRARHHHRRLHVPHVPAGATSRAPTCRRPTWARSASRSPRRSAPRWRAPDRPGRRDRRRRRVPVRGHRAGHRRAARHRTPSRSCSTTAPTATPTATSASASAAASSAPCCATPTGSSSPSPSARRPPRSKASTSSTPPSARPSRPPAPSSSPARWTACPRPF